MTPYNAAVAAVQMPPRIRSLPISAKGYPVPWFVAWLDGVPDFRVVRPNGVAKAHNGSLCWICGQQLGRFKAMTIGPMCAINRVSAEPPSHRDCSIFAALACPFLSNPRTKRREGNLPEDRIDAPGIAIARNPGATCVWISEAYLPFKTPDGGHLFDIGAPVETLWYANGRTATREEVMDSITSGLPLLQEQAAKDGASAILELARMTADAMKLLPA